MGSICLRMFFILAERVSSQVPSSTVSTKSEGGGSDLDRASPFSERAQLYWHTLPTGLPRAYNTAASSKREAGSSGGRKQATRRRTSASSSPCAVLAAWPRSWSLDDSSKPNESTPAGCRDISAVVVEEESGIRGVHPRSYCAAARARLVLRVVVLLDIARLLP
ncbi:hypothetical protein AAT19DRAFT_13038 [Rhodotorula toruloides]|uniref:Secreted protein n=1 Tax=Rhodotorula toruloides TaxID=5286 RepID=A0A2T0ADC8_RHOTO|nr:hypothetical protein AAT19DRAFT_13038 [Rhodotorula toruloides]